MPDNIYDTIPTSDQSANIYDSIPTSDQSAASPQLSQIPGEPGGFQRTMMSMVPFGRDVGAVGAAAGKWTGDVLHGRNTNFIGDVSNFRDQDKQIVDQYIKDHPVMGRAAEAAGIVPGITADAATAGTGLLRQIGENVGAGALYGAGISDGSLADRAEAAGAGAVTGGALAAAAPIATKIGRGAAQIIGNLGTHTGAESIRQATRAGFQGGDAGHAFLDAMRGKGAPEDVVEKARDAVSQMKVDKNAAYNAGMADVKNDSTILDFGKIDNALDETSNIGRFKAKVLSPDAVDLHSQLSDLVDNWRGSVPETYHTPEGLDALKQAIGDKVYGAGGAEPGSQAKVIGDKVYNAVRDTIKEQAPTYAKTMSGYADAQDQIWQIEKTLSLNPSASVDTSLRKLQSVMRSNVNTNYGARQTLADQLNKVDPTILPTIAGQSMQNWTANGLGKLAAVPALIQDSQHLTNPWMWGSLPLQFAAQSPRAIGEAAYGLGAAGRYAQPIAAPTRSIGQALLPRAAAQSGLIPNQQ